jgi:putative aldouronate transport system substrate-binding protein
LPLVSGQEYLLTQYGVPDVHYTLDASGNPSLTRQGQTDVSQVWQYVASPASVLYYPQAQGFVAPAQMDERAWLAAGVNDPTLGYFSNTAVGRGPGLDQAMSDGVADLVVGRRDPSELDQLVRTWRSSGGDQIRQELQRAIQAAG